MLLTSAAVPDNRWDLLPPPSRTPTAAVVVPFYDQPEALGRLLAGVMRQRGDVIVTEVAVGDDGSTRPPVVPDWYDGPPVRVFRQPDEGCRPGAARNLAAAGVEADVLVFLDADMVPDPDYVARVARLAGASPEVLVVGSRLHHDFGPLDGLAVGAWLDGRGPAPTRLEDPAWLREGYARSDHLRNLDDRSYQWVVGAVMSMSRALFEEVGGFDPTIDHYGGEDWDLAFRAIQAGALLAHVEAVAHHDGPDWRGREGADGTKNDERLALLARIPSLDDGVLTPDPVAVIRLRGDDPDRTLAAAARLLRAEPSGIRVVVPDGMTAWSADPRLVGAADEPSWGLRTSARIDLGTDRWAPTATTVRRLLRPLAVGASGAVEVVDGSTTVASGIGTRRLRRTARWRAAGVDGDDLFGPAHRCSPSEAGLERWAEPLDLADEFPR